MEFTNSWGNECLIIEVNNLFVAAFFGSWLKECGEIMECYLIPVYGKKYLAMVLNT